jgi:hypothetical protein
VTRPKKATRVPEPTPVDELRTAAATLQETAAPILTASKNTTGKSWYGRGDLAEVLHDQVGTPSAVADDAWITLMSPAFAEVLAVLLEAIADAWPRQAVVTSTAPAAHVRRQALAAARAVNARRETVHG